MTLVTRKLLILIIIFFCASCVTKNKATLTPKTQKIIERLKLISNQENLHLYKKDSIEWRKHFVHSNSVFWIFVEEDVTLRAIGWNDLNQFISKWMKENPTPYSDIVLKHDTIQDFKVEIADKLAFVQYKKNHVIDGKVKMLLQSRTFKLINNEWKILGFTSAVGYSTTNSTKNVFLHRDVKEKSN
ncbi:MAG: hypothetical protein EAZ15_05840 [Sphingobacteriales bacterium]|nr:MAG: hypothetical protein EAZ15_05840 [Sphingobacteriales bacterium]